MLPLKKPWYAVPNTPPERAPASTVASNPLCGSVDDLPGPPGELPFGGPKLGSVMLVVPPSTETPGIAGVPLVPLPAPPGPGYGEIPLRALESAPRPEPSLPAPEPSPESPLPGPLPRPMPFPPPLPPRSLFAVPSGDIAIAPPPFEFGKPTVDPGWLDTTTPFPEAFPLLPGGAIDEPRSSGPPAPLPLLPRPAPVSAFPPPTPPTVGGGGTTEFASNPDPPRLFLLPPLALLLAPFDAASLDAPFLLILSAGGTACVPSVPLPDLVCDPPAAADGGGGTGGEGTTPMTGLPPPVTLWL